MTKQQWQNYCHQWLGFQPNENSFKNARIKLAALLDRLLNHTCDDDSPFEEVLQEARVCVMCLIGGLLCPDATGNTVSLLYLRHMENIDEESTSNWGTAVLAYLYRELCTASQRGKTNIGGAMQLLQIWAWSRIITLAPIPSNNVADLMPTIDDPENILPVPPYARRWSYHISQTHTAHNAIRIIRNTLDRMQENEYNLAENMTQQAENSDPNDFTALRDLRSRTIAYGHQFMNFSSERYPSVRNRPPGTNEPDPSNVYTPAGNVYTEAGPCLH
ncbi:UNVERIFIED_CONTAM: hypothetical protein Sradi_0640700 [Sesamum radiatum]|uniref:Aminotransferase-like plant mobile domain-containing protein n=1 Tax=Sesamum radiatum TaxID=300843 RepID=A0AAW2VLR2_SESRA